MPHAAQNVIERQLMASDENFMIREIFSQNYLRMSTAENPGWNERQHFPRWDFLNEN